MNEYIFPLYVLPEEVIAIHNAKVLGRYMDQYGNVHKRELLHIVYRDTEQYMVNRDNPRYIVGSYGTYYDRVTRYIIQPWAATPDFANSYQVVPGGELHRIMSREFYDARSHPGYVTDHICGRKSLNTLDNLRLVPVRINNIMAIYTQHYNEFSRVVLYRENKKRLPNNIIRRICELIIETHTIENIKKILMNEMNCNVTLTDIRVIRYSTPDHHSIEWDIVQEYYWMFPKLKTINFSATQIEEMCKLLNEGMGNREIAEELGIPYDKKIRVTLKGLRSKSSYKEIVAKYPNIKKLVRDPFTREEAIACYELLIQGLDSRQIAERLGYKYDATFPSFVSNLRQNNYKNRFLDLYEIYKDRIPSTMNYSLEEIDLICQGINDHPDLKSPDLAKVIGFEYTDKFRIAVTQLRSKAIFTEISDRYPNIKRIGGERFSHDEIHMICHMLSIGKSKKEIAEALGVPADNKLYCLLYSIRTGRQYQDIAKQYGLISDVEIELTKEYAETIFKAYMKGARTPTEICKSLGIQYTGTIARLISNVTSGKVFPEIKARYNKH